MMCAQYDDFKTTEYVFQIKLFRGFSHKCFADFLFIYIQDIKLPISRLKPFWNEKNLRLGNLLYERVLDFSWSGFVPRLRS